MGIATRGIERRGVGASPARFRTTRTARATRGPAGDACLWMKVAVKRVTDRQSCRRAREWGGFIIVRYRSRWRADKQMSAEGASRAVSSSAANRVWFSGVACATERSERLFHDPAAGDGDGFGGGLQPVPLR
jgi:hypothetical protein